MAPMPTPPKGASETGRPDGESRSLDGFGDDLGVEGGVGEAERSVEAEPEEEERLLSRRRPEGLTGLERSVAWGRWRRMRNYKGRASRRK